MSIRPQRGSGFCWPGVNTCRVRLSWCRSAEPSPSSAIRSAGVPVSGLELAGMLATSGPVPGGPLLELEDLTVRLNIGGSKRAVLRGVSLSVNPGEAVGLVGESGSGKSMTVRAISRLLPPGAGVEGAIRFEGRDVMTLAVVSRILDILFAFPGILLAILAIALFGAGLPSAVVALAVAHMPYIARVTRAAAILERGLPYVAALRVHGFSAIQICTRHLLRNLAPLITAQATVSFGYVMVDLAAISFLGLGVQPPSADWGVMVASGEPSILEGHPQQSLCAGILIVITVCAFTILGERLADPDRASGTSTTCAPHLSQLPKSRS
jgi:energy-coupling factor transporter ATP-binding protein EcfA2